MGGMFKLKSKFKPTGDQPEAIAALYEGLKRGEDRLILQGVTGSGKTFHLAMRFAIVKVLPEPVTPCRISRSSPRLRPS